MKKIAMLMALVSGVALAASEGLVSSVPGDDWKVTVTINQTASSTRQLIAAWANADKGSNPIDWTEYADAGHVASGETSKVFEVPEKWRGKSGAIRFFLMSKTPPYASRFDFVTRPVVAEDGDAFVNTTICPDDKLDIRVKFRSDYMSGSPAMCPFGISSTVYIMPYAKPNNDSKMLYWFDFFGAKGTTENGILDTSHTNVFGDAPPRDKNPHEFRLCSEGLYIDGYRHLAFDQSKITGSTDKQLTLFGRYNSWKQKGTSCSIYYAIIQTNGVPAREYVPCQKTDGMITLYDRVTESFANIAGNATDRHLEAGNDVGPHPSDCGDVVCVSDAVGIAPSISLAKTTGDSRSITVSISGVYDDGLLFAFADTADKGTEVSSWEKNLLVQKVASGTGSVTVDLPADWWRNKYNVRFAWKSLAGMPYDYEVDRLDSDGEGKAHIMTGWKPTINTSISVTAKARRGVCTFGVATYFTLFLNTDGYVYWGFFGNKGSVNLSNVGEFVSQYHEWRLGPDGASIDKMQLATFSEATPASDLESQITLPFRINYAKPTLSDKEGEVSVKGAKIWEGDVLVRDFVPCVKNGTAGFYDRVRGLFYESRFDAEFAAGSAIVSDGDMLSLSESRILRNGTVVVFR